jgi:chromosomal replication initiation ATPase DnaA
LLTYNFIGKTVGGFNHATVLHGIRNIKDLLTWDKNLQTDIEIIYEKLKKL